MVRNWFLVYGVPKRTYSAQGRCFEAEIVQELCCIYDGIKAEVLHTTPKEMASVSVSTAHFMTCYSLSQKIHSQTLFGF